MKIIRTVNGDISPDTLGVTQVHEHLSCDTTVAKSAAPFPAFVSPMIIQDVDTITRELQDFHAASGRAMVEVTVIGWGRDVLTLQEMSLRSGVHIIATSGFYTREYIPEFARSASVEYLTEFLVAEINEGIEGTGIKAGLLKAGCSYPVIEGLEKKCATAVAKAAVQTGAAVTTHSPAAGRFEVPGGNLGYQYLEIFESAGLDPARVIIGHADQNADIRQLVDLAKRGASIEFDVIGKNHRLLDETRIELLGKLADAGFEKNLLLSTDRCRIDESKVFGGPGYDHLLLSFIPRLKASGFEDTLIHQMLVENPAEILAIQVTGDRH